MWPGCGPGPALKFKSLPRGLIVLAESNMSSSAYLVSGGNAGVLGATARAGLPWGPEGLGLDEALGRLVD